MCEKAKKRIHYIDRLRGLAVISMFHVHSAVAWLTPEAKETAYYKYSMKLSGMVAPVFMFLVGISIGIIAERQRKSGKEENAVKKRITKRGVQILIMGYALHFVFYLFSGNWSNWMRLLKVDILHCIGITMTIVPWIAWPKRLINWPAILLFIAVPLLSMVIYRFPVIDHLPAGLAAYVVTTTRLALFPIVPYMAWIMLGLVVAPIYTRAITAPGKERLFWAGLIASAVIMWFSGKGLKTLYYSLSLHTLGTDTPQIKGVIHFFWLKGAIVLGVFGLVRAAEMFVPPGRLTFLVKFGRRSLFAYCTHLFIVYPILGPHLRRSLSPQMHLLSTALLIVGMYFLVWGDEIIRKRIGERASADNTRGSACTKKSAH